MTVTSTNQKVTFNGDGSTTVFAYNYKIFAQTDLLVILRVTATGTETTQSLTTNYTVSGVGEASGGNVTMGTAPASGTTLTILRVQPNLQGLDLVPNDPFPAGNLESSLDKLTFMVQTHEEEIGRSIKASKANTITTTDFTISATDRANKVFAFDSSGDLSVTQELGIFRGNWAASTAYAQRDLVKDTSTANIFIVNTAHTSSGAQPLTDNANAAKYDIIVDAASATTSKTAAASSATAAANSATASASSATTSGNSATASANSATTSGNSATTSGNSATASGNSATASANSATASANSATASANSATSAAASAADVAKVQGITNGTIAANKAVVVDGNKDASSFRNLTASGAVTAGSLVIGSADIAEAELEMLDGITAGTAAASKAMVLDSAKDISGGRNLTISGELDAGSLDISGDIDVDGTTNLDVVDIDGAVNMATTALVTGVLTTTAATIFNGGFASNGNSTVDGTFIPTGVVTANAGVVVDTMTLDAATLAATGDLTLDVAGAINLDAGADGVVLKLNGANRGSFTDGGSASFEIKSLENNADMHFRGIDNNSEITALTLNMSEGGAATFNGTLIAKQLASADGVLLLDDNGSHNGIINSPASLRINIDSDNGATGESFQVGKNQTSIDANNILFQVSESGNVTKPLQPSFRAGRNSNYTPNAGAAILFNDVGSNAQHFNIGGHYNTSNGKFTLPVDGRYYIKAQIIFGPGLSDGQAMDDSFGIFKNGVRQAYSARRAEYVSGVTGNSGFFVDNADVIVSGSANQYIEIRPIRTLGVHGNTTYTMFMGYLIG